MDETRSAHVDSLQQACDTIRDTSPFLEPVIEAFRGIITGRELLKTAIQERPDAVAGLQSRGPSPDGHPRLTRKDIAALVDPWSGTVRSALETLKAFPGIRQEIERTVEALDQGGVDLNACMESLVEGRQDDTAAAAGRIGIPPAAFEFILGQILKPFVEKRTEKLRAHVSDMPWHRGCCPVCGEMPELSFLQGEEGQRRLRCSLCGHDWRFDRMACPYCAEKHADREIISIETEPNRWAEMCPSCRRYIVAADLRAGCPDAIAVAALGMVHLDMIAQARGYAPVAACAWNLVPPPASDVKRNANRTYM